jgi:IS1 family transposase
MAKLTTIIGSSILFGCSAPEVIGEKYSEKADMFPFHVGGAHAQAALCWAQLHGRLARCARHVVPGDCVPAFKKLMKKCWHADAKKRPAVEDVVAQLNRFCSEHAAAQR